MNITHKEKIRGERLPKVRYLVSIILFLLYSYIPNSYAEISSENFLSYSQAKFQLYFFHYIDENNLKPNRKELLSIIDFTFTDEIFEGGNASIISYTFRPVLRQDNVGLTSKVIDEKTESHDEYYLLNIPEAYLNISLDNMELNIGKQIFSWGTADAYNPIDNINPYILIDIPTRSKIGVPALSLTYNKGIFSLDTVFIPWFTPSRLPSADNRWFSPLIEAANNISTPLVFEERELPADNSENMQLALRLKSSEIMIGWDWSLSFFDGIDSVGVMRTDSSIMHTSLTQVFPKYREYGISFSTTWRELEFHGEAGNHLTDDNNMDENYLEYVFGLNYTFSGLFPDHIERATLLLEYADEHLLKKKNADSRYVGTEQFVRPFNDTMITQLSIQFFDEFRLEIFGAYNLKQYDSYTGLKVIKKFQDNWEFSSGFDFFSGEEDSFYGVWRENDRFYTSLTYLY